MENANHKAHHQLANSHTWHGTFKFGATTTNIALPVLSLKEAANGDTDCNESHAPSSASTKGPRLSCRNSMVVLATSSSIVRDITVPLQ